MSAPDLRARMPVSVVPDVTSDDARPGDVEPLACGPAPWGLGVVCHGCGGRSLLSLDPAQPGPRWTVEAGDPRTGVGLTLSPSVHHAAPVGCGWHGWVRSGTWEPC